MTGYTVELRTLRYGVWYVTDVVFREIEEAALYVDELNHQWEGLIHDWRVVETLRRPTHMWTKYGGLTPLYLPGPKEPDTPSSDK